MDLHAGVSDVRASVYHHRDPPNHDLIEAVYNYRCAAWAHRRKTGEFCTAATTTFDSNSSASTRAIDRLSETAERAAVATALFTMLTVEGDPIVSLWLVDSDRAEIFTDSSQDSFAGDPFDWNQLD